MSVIATAARAFAASPVVDLFNHAHKKGAHVGSSTDSSTDASATTSAQGPTTNRGLFSSLLESLEQVIGISLTAPANAASVTAATTSAATAATGIAGTAATGGANSSNALGANIDAKA